MTSVFFVLGCAITAAPPTSGKGADSGADTATDCIDPIDWYGDADGDTFGTPLYTTSACAQPAGYVASNTDCDDTDDAVHPGVVETCDGVDQDCDGTIDDEALDATEWFADTDNDGYGDATNTASACEAPAGYTSDNADCDDAAFAVHPTADEFCNGEDDDCDGATDETDAVDALIWFADADADGFGDAENTTSACEVPAGYLADNNDCDDSRGEANPAAVEVCNGLDDDCDALADDNPTDPSPWYFDGDADGYGRASTSLSACDQPPNYVATDDDCNDVDAAIHPAAPDACDDVDSDCDGEVAEDDSVDAPTWYADADGDGFGALTSPKNACTVPVGYVADSTDCDDADDATSPVSLEYCGGGDENCDGVVDESTATDATSYYADADSDTYGDATTLTTSCTVIAGAVLTDTDCDDADAVVHPGAADTCSDGVDQDCDGVVDGGCWASGSVALADADLRIEGATTAVPIGYCVDAGTDVSGDAIPDVITSAYGSSTYGYFVVSGTSTGIVTANTTSAHFESTTAYVSDIVSGDADGDGVNDILAVGANTVWLDAGPFYPGSGTAGGRSQLTMLSGSGSTGAAAFSDMDGDGITEFAVGVPSDSGVYSGCVVWMFTNPLGTGHTGVASRYWPCGTASGAGYSMDGGQDVNGDGLDDLLIGNNAGSLGEGAYLLFGPAASSSILPPIADVTFTNGYGTYAGRAAALIPDADGDGLADVMLGSPQGEYGLGAAYLYNGVSAGSVSVTAASATLTGTSAGTGFGYAVDGADIDQDGISDLLVDFQYGDSTQFFGPVSGALDAGYADTTFDVGGVTGDVANGGDVEGVGFDSVVVSDPSAGGYAGGVYVFYGAGR